MRRCCVPTNRCYTHYSKGVLTILTELQKIQDQISDLQTQLKSLNTKLRKLQRRDY